jgi:hypothetical protein
MTILTIILVCLFALVLGLLISILLYKPHPEVPKTETAIINKVSEPAVAQKVIEKPTDKPQKEKAGPSCRQKEFLQELHVRFPDMKIYMEVHPMTYGLLLHWKGKARTKENDAVVITDSECQISCLQALERMYEHNEVSQYGIYLVFPYQRSVENDSCQESRKYLTDLGIKIAAVLMDGSDNEYLLQQARSQALIGTGTGAYMEIKVNGNPHKTQMWIDGLRPAEMLSLHCTRAVRRVVASLKEQIPLMIRIELYVLPSKGLHDLLILMPAAWTWMRASVEKKKDSLILHAPEDDLLAEAFRILEEDASRQAFYLTDVRHLKKSESVPREDIFFQRIQNAITESCNVKGIVPVPVAETGSLGKWEGCRTCRYLPLTENKKESLESAILFYQSFFTRA